MSEHTTHSPRHPNVSTHADVSRIVVRGIDTWTLNHFRTTLSPDEAIALGFALFSQGLELKTLLKGN